jgi:hypothetical protein
VTHQLNSVPIADHLGGIGLVDWNEQVREFERLMKSGEGRLRETLQGLEEQATGWR